MWCLASRPNVSFMVGSFCTTFEALCVATLSNILVRALTNCAARPHSRSRVLLPPFRLTFFPTYPHVTHTIARAAADDSPERRRVVANRRWIRRTAMEGATEEEGRAHGCCWGSISSTSLVCAPAAVSSAGHGGGLERGEKYKHNGGSRKSILQRISSPSHMEPPPSAILFSWVSPLQHSRHGRPRLSTCNPLVCLSLPKHRSFPCLFDFSFVHHFPTGCFSFLPRCGNGCFHGKFYYENG